MSGYPGTSFPTALDTLNQIGPGGGSEQTPNSFGETHPGLHAQLAATLAAIETVIGITGSSDPNSIQYKIGQLGGAAGLGQNARDTSGGATITNADRGFLIVNNNGASVLPALASVAPGFTVAFFEVGNSSTISSVGSEPIYRALQFSGAATSLTLQAKECVILMADPVGGIWVVIGGTGIQVQSAGVQRVVRTITDAATLVAPAALAGIFDITIAASRIMGLPTNLIGDGQMIIFRITQGGSGSNLITWNAVFDFGAAGAPVLSTAVGSVDIIAGIYNLAKAKWEMVPASLGYT